MYGPFTRNCSVSLDEAGTACLAPVNSSISESGHETMWCNRGHQIREWYVLDAQDKRIALAKLNTSPQILDLEMAMSLSIDPLYRSIRPRAPKPDRPCKRGHNDWFMNPDERYRCRQCKRERYERARKAMGKKVKPLDKPKRDPEEIKRTQRDKIRKRYQNDPDFRKRRRISSRKYWAKYAKKKKEGK